ncbi:DegT/DnrJ/EryC1/StrS family aminotransferase [Shewanella sp. 0m-8]
MNIPLVKVGMPPANELMPALESVLYSGMIAEGDAVYQFEDQFKKQFGIKNGISMSSGTAALHAALHLSNVQPGDEVITTSMTAEPTNTSILQVGAVPVFADVDPLNGNISAESILAKITSKTKAILVVHYAGYPVELGKIKNIAEKYRLILIEDCAHSLGAKYDNNCIGTIGDFSIFSFQAIKHMTTVDGGFLCMKDEGLIKKAKKFRWFGMEKGVPRTEVDITDLGYKYNMQNVSATIGLFQLKCIQNKIERHIDNGKYFNTVLANVSGLTPAKFDVLAEPSYWLYTLLSDDSDDVITKLEENGVTASKLHRPNHFHTIFSKYASDSPCLEQFYKKLVHIPCGWWLSNSDREKISDILRQG